MIVECLIRVRLEADDIEDAKKTLAGAVIMPVQLLNVWERRAKIELGRAIANAECREVTE